MGQVKLPIADEECNEAPGQPYMVQTGKESFLVGGFSDKIEDVMQEAGAYRGFSLYQYVRDHVAQQKTVWM